MLSVEEFLGRQLCCLWGSYFGAGGGTALSGGVVGFYYVRGHCLVMAGEYGLLANCCAEELWGSSCGGAVGWMGSSCGGGVSPVPSN